jgi:hypothetical protein
MQQTVGEQSGPQGENSLSAQQAGLAIIAGAS